MEDYKIPEEERQKMIESLIDNKEIKRAFVVRQIQRIFVKGKGKVCSFMKRLVVGKSLER